MQQINLYLPEFQPNREPLRSVHMVSGLVLFILLLVAFSVYTASQNKSRALGVESGRQQLLLLSAQFTQLEQQRQHHNLAQLDAEIMQLQGELQRREQILNIIANQKLGNNTGYSMYLQALGSESLPTISLQAFSLQQGGNYVEFAGQTHAADQVPFYLQRLRTHAVFAESAFGVLHIKPAHNGGFDFSLAKENPRNAAMDTKTAVQTMLELNEKMPTSGERGQN